MCWHEELGEAPERPEKSVWKPQKVGRRAAALREGQLGVGGPPMVTEQLGSTHLPPCRLKEPCPQEAGTSGSRQGELEHPPRGTPAPQPPPLEFHLPPPPTALGQRASPKESGSSTRFQKIQERPGGAMGGGWRLGGAGDAASLPARPPSTQRAGTPGPGHRRAFPRSPGSAPAPSRNRTPPHPSDHHLSPVTSLHLEAPEPEDRGVLEGSRSSQGCKVPEL
ncbi:collagen alpha-1(I) chain-like isoform X2 [Erinaceus europaeus]|uniref:Collagen alpha-1(I) chain-like isoform X2 n=1 Tax=Erinaceus europaeus TaxID=9365 RepID=A0ABM3WT60_ERIEU|nr:collagen alpha-1(I) chain-like isoform X2 [Erinaceus europaeus]